MSERRRFKPGHPVECLYPATDEYRAFLEGNGTEFAESDDKLHVKAFVVGDTDDKGFSLVSLSNPEHCIAAYSKPINMPQKIYDLISRGYLNCWLTMSKNDDIFVSVPWCGYA